MLRVRFASFLLHPSDQIKRAMHIQRQIQIQIRTQIHKQIQIQIQLQIQLQIQFSLEVFLYFCISFVPIILSRAPR